MTFLPIKNEDFDPLLYSISAIDMWPGGRNTMTFDLPAMFQLDTNKLGNYFYKWDVDPTYSSGDPVQRITAHFKSEELFLYLYNKVMEAMYHKEPYNLNLCITNHPVIHEQHY